MLSHFNKKYFHVKINISGDIQNAVFPYGFWTRVGRGHTREWVRVIYSLSEQSSRIVPSFNSAAIFSLLFSNSPGL